MRLTHAALLLPSLLFLTLGPSGSAQAQVPGPGQTAAGATAAATDAAVITPLLARPLTTPRPQRLSNGTIELLYELELRAPVAVTLEQLELLDPDRGDAPIASYTAEQLLEHSRFLGRAEPFSPEMPAGNVGIARINLVFTSAAQVPQAIVHRFTITAAIPPAIEPARLVERIARTRVDREPAIAIGPPLAGERWLAVSVGGDRVHRKAVMPINGDWIVPERWAVDFVMLDHDGRIVTGDPSRNQSYLQYGLPLLAVANGRVVQVRDNEPELTPGAFPEGMTLERAGGNFVVLDIGRGICAFYAHLIPGSLRVAAGQRVRRGQVLGLLGNSGNSDAPHLHFQVNQGCEPLSSDGIPFVIDRFRLDGQVVSADELNSELEHPEVPVTIVTPPGAGPRRGELPNDLALVSFPGGR